MPPFSGQRQDSLSSRWFRKSRRSISLTTTIRYTPIMAPLRSQISLKIHFKVQFLQTMSIFTIKTTMCSSNNILRIFTKKWFKEFKHQAQPSSVKGRSTSTKLSNSSVLCPKIQTSFNATKITLNSTHQFKNLQTNQRPTHKNQKCQLRLAGRDLSKNHNTHQYRSVLMMKSQMHYLPIHLFKGLSSWQTNLKKAKSWFWQTKSLASPAHKQEAVSCKRSCRGPTANLLSLSYKILVQVLPVSW